MAKVTNAFAMLQYLPWAGEFAATRISSARLTWKHISILGDTGICSEQQQRLHAPHIHTLGRAGGSCTGASDHNFLTCSTGAETLHRFTLPSASPER